MKCVLFDLDGTLVDSEWLGNQAILDVLPIESESIETLTTRYRGLELASILNDLAKLHGLKLPDDIVAIYRQRMGELFDSRLRAFPGANEMLASLAQPKCIASGGPPEKIQRSLRLTKLAHHFEERIFSSYVLNSWKPEPDLFLHAASEMGFAPHDCVVIEDSEVGVRAARSAGMQVIQFCPHPELVVPGARTVSELCKLTELLST
jgi:HAD superfamily hydrolase (TIGR01509 family)